MCRLEVAEFANGPLPSFLSQSAYLTPSEFALPRDEALRYLEWCQAEGLEVVGFDVWAPTVPGPTAYTAGAEGDAGHCSAVIAGNSYSALAASLGLPVVYNIWVAKAEPPAA